MKNLRNLLLAFLWVWGTALTAGFLIFSIVEKSWVGMVGIIVIILFAITLVVYKGFNGDFE